VQTGDLSRIGVPIPHAWLCCNTHQLVHGHPQVGLQIHEVEPIQQQHHKQTCLQGTVSVHVHNNKTPSACCNCHPAATKPKILKTSNNSCTRSFTHQLLLVWSIPSLAMIQKARHDISTNPCMANVPLHAGTQAQLPSFKHRPGPFVLPYPTMHALHIYAVQKDKTQDIFTPKASDSSKLPSSSCQAESSVREGPIHLSNPTSLDPGHMHKTRKARLQQ
jgi:hypothetical protein